MNKLVMTGIAALALAASGTAFAQGAPPAAPPAKAGWYGKHHRNAEARLAKLKSQLNITAAQEPAWNRFTTALQNLRPARPSRMMAKKPAGLTPAPEVFDALAKRAQQRAQKAQALAQSVSGLYRTLTPTQRAVFDTHLADMRNKTRHHWGRRGGWKHPPMKRIAPPPASGGNG